MLIKEAQKSYLNKLLEELKTFEEHEIKEFFSSLTSEKAESYGFRKWSETSPVYLIPYCFLDFIPIGTELISIMGTKVIYDGANIDDDTRCGLLAYGIILKED